MSEKKQIQFYSVADLSDWLLRGKQVQGLSHEVISPVRAFSIMNNPYVRDEDAVVCALFVDGSLAAYTASFPELLDGNRIWWCTTLYCAPQYTGRGYAFIVFGSLKEVHEPEETYDRWGVEETVEVCKLLGMQTCYTIRYSLSHKTINKDTPKGQLAFIVQRLQKAVHPWPKHKRSPYKLKYLSFVDTESYSFMRENKGSDLWLREMPMLNWILQFPFMIGCYMLEPVSPDCSFTSNVSDYEYKLVKVYLKDSLIGVYILRNSNDTLSVLYLYFLERSKEDVFSSIMDHIISLKPKTFVTENAPLLSFVKSSLYFPKLVEERVSISLPNNIELPKLFTLQMGDGDSFA